MKYTFWQNYPNCEFELEGLDINSVSSTHIKILKHLKSMKTVISYFQMFDKLWLNGQKRIAKILSDFLYNKIENEP